MLASVSVHFLMRFLSGLRVLVRQSSWIFDLATDLFSLRVGAFSAMCACGVGQLTISLQKDCASWEPFVIFKFTTT